MNPISLHKLVSGFADIPRTDLVSAVVTDSRAVGPGSVFVAIQGERVDGHNYAAAALAAGAVAVVAEHPMEGVPPDRSILVKNSLDAMIAMGGAYRSQFDPVVVGVTGSVGKTTTKELCGAVFSRFGQTLKTQGNQNNELGVPNTLFRLEPDTRYAVVEMGMDGMGDLHKLSAAVRPDLSIITRIGVSHIEKLGSRENILQAKMEICDYMPEGGTVAVNGDDDLLARAVLPRRLRKVTFGIDDRFAQVLACDIESSTKGEEFTIRDRLAGEFHAFIPAVGRHNVYNALAAYTAGTRLGLDPARCAAALADYETTGLRQHIVQKCGMTVIEDCYNANPDSMAAGLSALAALGKTGRTVAVLGDMLELGGISAQAHRTVGRQAAENGVALLVCRGEESRRIAESAKEAGLADSFFCETDEQAAELLFERCRAGDTLLFKASRGMAFEHIFEQFYRLLEQR